MKNNFKIGIPILVAPIIPFLFNNVDSHAVTSLKTGNDLYIADTDNPKIGFETDSTTTKYYTINGTKGSSTKYSQGEYLSGALLPTKINGSTTYSPDQKRVQSAMKKGYGFTLYYYEPYANKSGKLYSNTKQDGVAENTKASHSNPNYATSQLTPNYGNSTKTSLGSDVLSKDYRNGSRVEWRYLGYNGDGDVVTNPFFPDDSGNRGHKLSDTLVIRKQSTKYDKVAFKEAKEEAINKFREQDPIAATYSTADLMDKLSLLTNPQVETPMFHRWTTEGYYGTLIGPNITEERELQVSAVCVYDMDNNLIQGFYRDSGGNISRAGTGTVYAGQKVKVKYEIENVGQMTTSVTPGKIMGGMAYGNAINQSNYSDKYSSNQINLVVRGGSKIAPGEKIGFEAITMVIPEDTGGVVRISGYMHEDYAIAGESGVISDDWGEVLINVEGYEIPEEEEEDEIGDSYAQQIQMIDKSGNVVDHMKPGEEYKLRYTFKYNGPDVEFEEPYQKREWCSHGYFDGDGRYVADGHYVWNTYYRPVQRTFTFTYSAKQYLPGGGSDIKTFTKSESRYSITNGTTWTFETPYYVWEVPSATGAMSMVAPSEVDSYVGNNNKTRDWDCEYDVILSNVRLYNKNERPTQNGTITMGIKYDIEITSKHSKDPYFETDLKTNITLPSGTVLQFTDHVKKGLNKDITREIQVPVTAITSGSKDLKVEVLANSDKKFWEVDLATQTNNKGSATTVQLPAVNPNTSKGCSVVKNTNSFSVNHIVNNYSGNNVSWTRFNGSASYSFYKYNATKDNSSTQNKTYNESYKINYVKFKSKYTTDKGYGSNGWVDLTTSEKDKAIMKAGYGYELAIEVEYKTDVFKNQPTAYDTRTGSTAKGTTVSSLSNKANIYKDIYVRTSDGKILSATGMYGTTAAFDVTTVSSDEHSTVLRYTMKNTTNNGETSPVKIYTSEDAKDGNYGITVWTPTITGVGNPQKTETELCDQKNIQFTIKGSMYDDTEDSIIQ